MTKRGLGPPGLFTLIGRDVRKRAFRNAASSGAVAAVVGALFVTMLLTAGAAYSTQQVRDKLGADIVVLPKETALSPRPFYTLLYIPGPSYISDGYLQAVQSVPGVKQTSAELYVTYFVVVGGGGYGNKFWVLSVDPNNFMLGGWMPQNVSRTLRAGDAVLGWEFPRFSDMPNHGQFFGTKLTPVYRMPRTGTFMDRVMFVSLDTARDMLEWQKLGIDPGPCCDWELPITFGEGQVSAVFVKVDVGADPKMVANKIGSGFQGIHAVTLDSLVGSANNRLGELLSTSSVSGSLVWFASALLVSAATSAATNERSREFGMIRALGATRWFMGKLVVVQTILVAGLGGLVGIVVSWILFSSFYSALISALGIPYQSPPLDQLASLVLLAAGSSVAIGALAAVWPAIRVSFLDPYDTAKRSTR